MRTALLLAALLVVGTVAPVASADHYQVCSDEAPQACFLASDTVNGVAHYVECFYRTAPAGWVDDCV